MGVGGGLPVGKIFGHRRCGDRAMPSCRVRGYRKPAKKWHGSLHGYQAQHTARWGGATACGNSTSSHMLPPSPAEEEGAGFSGMMAFGIDGNVFEDVLSSIILGDERLHASLLNCPACTPATGAGAASAHIGPRKLRHHGPGLMGASLPPQRSSSGGETVQEVQEPALASQDASGSR